MDTVLGQQLLGARQKDIRPHGTANNVKIQVIFPSWHHPEANELSCGVFGSIEFLANS